MDVERHTNIFFISELPFIIPVLVNKEAFDFMVESKHIFSNKHKNELIFNEAASDLITSQKNKIDEYSP